jgi:hypothetical protein
MTIGRHSLGRPGLARRDWPGLAPQRDGRRRARHRRGRTRRQSTAEAMAFLVAATVLGMLAVSGWYTATGATAVAQMLAR